MMDSHFRSLVKTFSWRAAATIITFIVAMILTNKAKLAMGIGIADTFLKLGAYYLHERLWDKVKFGRKKQPEYHI